VEELAAAGENVNDLRHQYNEIAQARRRSGEQIEELRKQSRALWIEIKRLLRAADTAHETPTDDLHRLIRQRQEIIARILARAGGENHQRLQEQYHDLVLEIQQRKLNVIADAYRTIGLEISNYRPPWWWFLAIDPSGAWLQRLAETATMRLEPFGMMV